MGWVCQLSCWFSIETVLIRRNYCKTNDFYLFVCFFFLSYQSLSFSLTTINVSYDVLIYNLYICLCIYKFSKQSLFIIDELENWFNWNIFRLFFVNFTFFVVDWIVFMFVCVLGKWTDLRKLGSGSWFAISESFFLCYVCFNCWKLKSDAYDFGECVRVLSYLFVCLCAHGVLKCYELSSSSSNSICIVTIGNKATVFLCMMFSHYLSLKQFHGPSHDHQQISIRRMCFALRFEFMAFFSVHDASWIRSFVSTTVNFHRHYRYEDPINVISSVYK